MFTLSYFNIVDFKLSASTQGTKFKKKVRRLRFGRLSISKVKYLLLIDITEKRLLTRRHARSLVYQRKLAGNL